MSLGRYSLLAVCVVAATLAAAWPLALRRLDLPARWAVAFGSLIALVNTTAAYGLLRWSAGRSTVAFMGALLGGMVGRMGLMLAALAVGILALRLPQLPLAVSLLGHFLLLLAIELAIVHRQTPAQRGTAS